MVNGLQQIVTYKVYDLQNKNDIHKCCALNIILKGTFHLK